ncbi:MAG: 1-acyl-sn-glycerol-3-phosphate acyltransferase [Bacteroidota bacterium]
MLYTVTRPLAKIALGVYFRKIYIVNKEVLPKDKPVILAANHPTAFIEPCILACWLDKPISFIARGDLYVNNFILRKLYDFYHMTPIFRREDTGYSNLRSNYETFEKCYETLKKRRPLMILVEGRTIHEKRMRPMRKGTARIVGGALEKHGDMDIHLIPVGINYTDSDSFRSVAMIEFGNPIKCSDYTELFNSHFPKAVNQLTKEMGDRLKEKIVHINEEKDDALVEHFLKLVENEQDDRIFPVSSVDSSLFQKQKKIADKINGLSGDEKDDLLTKAEDYYQKLNRNKISDFGLMKRNYASFKNTLFAIVGFIPAMLGYALNCIPFLLGKMLSKKIAPSIEFRAATFIVFSAFLYLFSGIGLYLAGYLMGFGWQTFWLTLIPVLGYFYIVYKDIMKKRKAGRKAAQLSQTAINDFIRERNDLKKMVL